MVSLYKVEFYKGVTKTYPPIRSGKTGKIEIPIETNFFGTYSYPSNDYNEAEFSSFIKKIAQKIHKFYYDHWTEKNKQLLHKMRQETNPDRLKELEMEKENFNVFLQKQQQKIKFSQTLIFLTPYMFATEDNKGWTFFELNERAYNKIKGSLLQNLHFLGKDLKEYTKISTEVSVVNHDHGNIIFPKLSNITGPKINNVNAFKILIFIELYFTQETD
ncbi:MAG: hypothetical protein ABIJ18_01240 [archaeon]